MRQMRRSGGVSVLCADHFKTKYIAALSNCSETIESCVVELEYNGEKFIILAVYRPHSGTVEDFNTNIDSMLQSAAVRGKSVIVLGDMNVDLLKYNSPHVVAFRDTMQSYSFFPIITKATRFPPPSSLAPPSLLDHIWTNRLGVCTSGIILLDGTDHCSVFVKLPIIQNIENKIKLTFRLHKPINIDNFEREVR